MNTYTVSAKSVGYLETKIKAKNEDEAYDKLEEMLENGELPEVEGWIENKEVKMV